MSDIVKSPIRVALGAPILKRFADAKKLNEVIGILNSVVDGAISITDVEVGNGTVALPSMTFAADLDTGIYRIGANNAGFAANGAKVLDIGTSGLAVTGALSATTTVTGTTGVVTDIVNPVTSGAGTSIKAPVNVVSGSTLTSATTPAISAATSGAIYTLAAAAITVTLPACSAANIGLRYKFVTTTTATAQIINTTGSDVFLGSVFSHLAVINATNDTQSGESTANKTMTMNGTTTGGLPGSVIEVVCISATQWLVTGRVIGASGTQATLFSN